MGHDPDREPPFFFMKPGDALLPTGTDFPYPPMTENVHYEMEFVVAIGKGGTTSRKPMPPITSGAIPSVST